MMTNLNLTQETEMKHKNLKNEGKVSGHSAKIIYEYTVKAFSFFKIIKF